MEGAPLLANKAPGRANRFSKSNWLFHAVQLFTAAGVVAILVVILYKSTRVDEGLVPNLLLNAAPSSTSGPVVEISNGPVRGTTLTSRSGRVFNAFYQLPYAEPPVGKLRFQAPRPYSLKWEGIRDASQRGGTESACVQSRGINVEGKEDCLFLSVFTPQLPSDEKRKRNLPVMVYIFGGAFTFGRSNRYGPDYMMDEDVVLVLFDFRVAAFGHLNTEDMEIRGNMALKDQVMALRWVQENIAKFGGDPKRVLIFGNSSGAAYVHGHLLSKMSRGLFSRAISQSGSVYFGGGIETRPLDSARQLGEALNCSNVNDTHELHNCLMQADYRDIALKFPEAQMDFSFLSKEFMPENGDTSDVFFEDYPITLSKKGTTQNVPWLAGNNNAESFPTAHSFLISPTTTTALNFQWNQWAPLLLNFDDTEDNRYAKLLRETYFGRKQIGNNTRYELVDIFSDTTYVNAVRLAVNDYARNGGEVHSYWMTHEPISGYGDLSKIGFPPPYGATHADEVQFLFPFTNEVDQKFPYIDVNSTDYKVSKNMIQIWTGFARDGVPTAPGIYGWPRIDKNRNSKPRWVEINDLCQVIQAPQRLDVLDKIPFKLPMH